MKIFLVFDDLRDNCSGPLVAATSEAVAREICENQVQVTNDPYSTYGYIAVDLVDTFPGTAFLEFDYKVAVEWPPPPPPVYVPPEPSGPLRVYVLEWV